MTPRAVLPALALLAAIVCSATPAQAQSRHALVVGIDDYRSVAKLSRAVGDARAMSGALQSLGFKMRLVENPDRNAMSTALAGFEESIEKGDTAFVFFAGHGIEIAGQNVLLPADVPDPGRASSGILRDAGFNTATLIERVTARGARSAFFVFDACRDNPYAKSGNTRAVGAARGLARTEAPEGVFVLMSAGQNQQALDSLNEPGKPATDKNPNSVFTRVLLEELGKPGLSHIVLAKAVQTRVRDLARSINHAQVPAFYDQIIGDVVLRPDGTPSAPPIASLPAAPAPAASAAKAAFELGTRWIVRETTADGRVYDGIWSRTGPRSFNAEWNDPVTRGKINDTIEFESQTGNAIVMYRAGVKGRYFGTLSANGRQVEGGASWYSPGTRWTAEIVTDSASARPNEAKVAAVAPLDLGRSWQVEERTADGKLYKGVWTRSGPRSFAAQWRDPVSGATTTDTIEVESQTGNAVVLYRSGIKGRYFGTLSPDGRSLQGSASWYGKGDRWSAQIR